MPYVWYCDVRDSRFPEVRRLEEHEVQIRLKKIMGIDPEVYGTVPSGLKQATIYPEGVIRIEKRNGLSFESRPPYNDFDLVKKPDE